jgi:hypothetical protein
MNEEQQAAYVFSQSVCALIEAMGMFASGEEYTEQSYDNLLNKYGIHHNSIMTLFNGR